jgi:hypothetical protein
MGVTLKVHAEHMQVFMYSICCPTLTKTGMYQLLLVQLPNSKFHDNLFVSSCMWTDMVNLMGASLQLFLQTHQKREKSEILKASLHAVLPPLNQMVLLPLVIHKF